MRADAQMRNEKRPNAGVVFAVALAVIAGACSAPSKSASSTPTPAAGNLSTFVSDIASDVRGVTDSVLGKLLGLGPAEDTDAKKAAAEKTAVGTRTPRRNRAPVVAPPKVDPEPLQARALPLAMEAPPAIVSAAFELPEEPDPSIVYSQADLDVEPPRLHSGDLPRWLPPGGLDVDTVEVVVSQEGGVERIKMISEPRRLIDMMALSAAKMWQFDPALKDGEPVRYRLVLPSPSTP